MPSPFLLLCHHPFYYYAITLLLLCHHPSTTMPSPFYYYAVTLLLLCHHPSTTMPSPFYYYAVTLLGRAVGWTSVFAPDNALTLLSGMRYIKVAAFGATPPT